MRTIITLIWMKTWQLNYRKLLQKVCSENIQLQYVNQQTFKVAVPRGTTTTGIEVHVNMLSIRNIFPIKFKYMYRGILACL